MSNFSYDDFAVLVRSFNLELLDSASLRIVPLSVAPSMAQAINGTIPTEGDISALEAGKAYLPLAKDGKTKVSSNVTVQHQSDGYCRLVGHLVRADVTRMFVMDDGSGSYPIESDNTVEIEGIIYTLAYLEDDELWEGTPPNGEGGNDPVYGTIEETTDGVSIATAFVLYRTDEDGSDQVLAVASLKEGFEIGEGCYPSFTITTVNNYQSVAFNPNAFATLEDLNAINGLDGLHIAFDQTTGDIKLLDKDGNVIDQANLPIKADVIIADGEEGYKYVKTDIEQDIHAAKAWMPVGETAWDDVEAVEYEMKHAALVVERRFAMEDGSSYPIEMGEGGEDVINVGDIIYDVTYLESDDKWKAVQRGEDSVMIGTVETSTLGITDDGEMMYTIAEGDATVTSISGENVPWLAQTELPAGSTLRYGLEAFVWTVKDPDAVTQGAFFATLNDSLRSLGFHEGDDIALGTNLQNLLAESMNEVDPEEYMHGEGNMERRAKEVADQRNLAKAELLAWNAQHPALTHNLKAGTIISSEGVDIRSGQLLISDGNDKHYGLSTNFTADPDSPLDDDRDRGLTISSVDASNNEVQVLTISESSYISGAPICMAMLEIRDADGLQGDMKRWTACFDCEMVEEDGTVNITITDNRSNSKGFGEDCIVEISPVYIPGKTAPEGGADIEIETATEMLPALNTVNTVVHAGGYKELTCTCPQIIDWANSVNLNEGGARLFAIVKVY